MKKQILVNFFLFAIFATLSLFSAPTKNGIISVDPKLSHCFNAIQGLEEGKKLISKILEEGPLNIQVADNEVAKQFLACWNQESRTIYISLAPKRSQGSVMASLIFELHNALVSSQMDNFDEMAFCGRINKEQYVRSIEHLEYVNSINASNLAEIGIKKGVFPKNAKLSTYRDFDEHFYYQKMSGHSAVIEKNYDLIVNP